MLSFKAHDLHVCGTCTDVFCRDVTASQRLNETSVRTQQGFAIRCFIVADDDRLAAPEWKSCERRLVSHALRQAQRVSKRFVFTFVIPETSAANGWTKHCTMDRDDAVVTTYVVAPNQNSLVISVCCFFGNFHWLG